MPVMPSLPTRLENFLANLDLLTDRADRIEALIDIAARFEEVSPEVARRPFPEENRVPACESEAFAFVTDQPDGTLRVHFAVENPQGISAMALAVILKEGLDGETPAVMAAVPREVVYRIFGRELSMGKSMGLTGMVGLLQSFAHRRL
jgi:cysteine desulfuration protein SufE